MTRYLMTAPMTLPKLTEAEDAARHARRLAPWCRAAAELVETRLADARAHAETAVTASLRATPDGRASAAVIRRNPSFKAALRRLLELWQAIGGPSATSIDGFVQDATEAFYRDSLAYWLRQVPDRFRAAGNPPTAVQANAARGMLWYGQPIRTAFRASIARASDDLIAALAAAGSTSATKRDGVTVIRTWEALHRARLTRYLALALGDASQRADQRAMTDAIAPKYLTAAAKGA